MAIERVRVRLQRTVATLAAANIPYAVAGGNAVAEWVGRVDEGAVRFTKDVAILLRRDDLPMAITAMGDNGFYYQSLFGVDMFLDGPDSKPSDAVHVVFAGEIVKPHDLLVTPDVDEVDHQGWFPVLSLEALVKMKLTSYRLRDQTHLADMVGVGLIDRTWLDKYPLEKYPAELAARLATILESPEF